MDRIVFMMNVSLLIRVSRALLKPGRLCNQIISFRNACCPASRGPVVFDGAGTIAEHLEQMGTNRVKTVMFGKPTIDIERLEKFETFRRAVYHGSCNCM